MQRDIPQAKPLERSEHDKLLRRMSQLDVEFSSWKSHLREINEVMMPRTGRFLSSDRNRGDKRRNNILDSTASRAVRILGAGMMSGASSAARPWFRLATGNPDLMGSESAQQWLFEVRRIMLNVFHQSNTYRSLHRKYEECGLYGTAASLLMDDFDTVVHDYGMTIGEFRLGADFRGDVNTLARELQKTVGELVKEFGYRNCSQNVQTLYDRGEYDTWITICHIVQPREFFDSSKRDNRNMPFQSVYFEKGETFGKVLRNSGMRTFRALTPRWNVVPGNVYGEGQGMEALGDAKQLQHQQLRKAQGIDYQSNPPLQVPSSMKQYQVDRLPGGITYYDAASGPQGGIRSTFEVPLRLDYLLEDIRDVRSRINQAFFTDMFLMIANDQSGPQQTATEVAEKHEEKMLMLGPVLENLHHEELRPRVLLTFERCLQAGLLPPPPPELEGQELNIEFVSILAQAQRAVATNSIDRYTMSLGHIATMKPEVLDKFDADEWADAYGDMLGIDPQLVVPNKEVAFIRQQRAQAQQQAAQSEQMSQAADTAQKLGKTSTQDGTAMGDIMRGLQGYTT